MRFPSSAVCRSGRWPRTMALMLPPRSRSWSSALSRWSPPHAQIHVCHACTRARALSACKNVCASISKATKETCRARASLPVVLHTSTAAGMHANDAASMPCMQVRARQSLFASRTTQLHAPACADHVSTSLLTACVLTVRTITKLCYAAPCVSACVTAVNPTAS